MSLSAPPLHLRTTLLIGSTSFSSSTAPLSLFFNLEFLPPSASAEPRSTPSTLKFSSLVGFSSSSYSLRCDYTSSSSFSPHLSYLQALDVHHADWDPIPTFLSIALHQSPVVEPRVFQLCSLFVLPPSNGHQPNPSFDHASHRATRARRRILNNVCWKVATRREVTPTDRVAETGQKTSLFELAIDRSNLMKISGSRDKAGP